MGEGERRARGGGCEDVDEAFGAGKLVAGTVGREQTARRDSGWRQVLGGRFGQGLCGSCARGGGVGFLPSAGSDERQLHQAGAKQGAPATKADLSGHENGPTERARGRRLMGARRLRMRIGPSGGGGWVCVREGERLELVLAYPVHLSKRNRATGRGVSQRRWAGAGPGPQSGAAALRPQ
ncbi:hypothetical protein BDY21DRAFT_86371 [Lineolata rhizophorae]|uniref:Uncharacterized protein n=1 Tax=Lineolata rhizophorae TaxID=578093 RepID=A0A6A6PCB2_9PEZI|nr:hypothetical protein BDY21DRAFT_86371 [Lineolata rhizophorae]